MSPDAYNYLVRTPSPARRSSQSSSSLSVSPAKRPSCGYSDRFIPSRAASNLGTGLSLLEKENTNPRAKGSQQSSQPLPSEGSDEKASAFTQLLRAELLGNHLSPGKVQAKDEPPRTPERGSLFRYQTPDSPIEEAIPAFPTALRSSEPSQSTPRPQRRLPKAPSRVLFAPQLADDFYSNLLDWSGADTLAVGRGGCVDLWNARTGLVTRLCDLGCNDSVTSIGWDRTGEFSKLAIGTTSGQAQVWDAERCCQIRCMAGQSRRIGALSWRDNVLSTGSRDKTILHRDVRQKSDFTMRLQGHTEEVCGLRWSKDQQQLASGGNEGSVCIWSLRSPAAEMKFCEHEAAVKALAWSPHQRGLLASGGGTMDKCIRTWNTTAGTALNCFPTGSQVCNMVWSENENVILSAHGYTGNEIVLWKYPGMTRIGTLLGHTARVLHLAVSPDGRTVVSGAGDETLRFWEVFRSANPTSSSVLGTSPGPALQAGVIR